MIRLRIKQHDENHIVLEALEGIDHFGFGTFLCDINPDQIECDAFSKNALLRATEKRGLNGMEIWQDNRIAWGDPSHEIVMPIKEISKMKGAERWLSKIIVSEK